MKKQQETKGAKKANFAKHEKKQKLQKMPKKTNNLITKIKNVAVVTITSIALVNTMLICGAKLGSKDPTTPSLHLATAPKFILSKIAQSTTSEEEQNTINDNSLSNNIQNSSATDNEENNNNSENNISTISSKKTNSIIRRVASANTNSSAYLSSIKIDGSELTGFSSAKLNYEETVTNSENTLTVERINENQQVDVNESFDASTKIKTLTILVTSVDGSNSDTYTVKLTNSSVTSYIPTTFDDDKYMSKKDNDSIIGKIKNINESGNTTITVNGIDGDGNSEEKSYDLDVIVYNGDLTLDGTTTVTGATLSSNVYEFGNTNDCATSSSYATRMVVLKVNGDLTINSGVTLTSVKNASGYGGPKGMTIYCTGTVTNNGTISMTARGAKAVGENVYLWKNEDGSFEYVPAVGGKKVTTSGESVAGTDGVCRQTGGGGTGYIEYCFGGRGGASSSGTSYSGGSGGGGTTRSTAGNASEYGGSGGYGKQWDVFTAGGGAGNPGGGGNYRGSNGTGGLLNIYATSLNNNNTITSNGSTAGSGYTPGGGSGGGSINIFFKENINNGKITTTGGPAMSNIYGRIWRI